MPVQKIDPKVIFASDAPAIDKPPVFSDKTKGWDVARANDGRPQIKEMNKVQQDTDLKILWLNENAVLPYDETIDYPDGAVTLKDGSFKQLSGGSWVEFLDDFADKDAVKRGIANRYDSSLTYNSGERVVLTNGDIVKSIIDENANDPSVDMTGWENFGKDVKDIKYANMPDARKYPIVADRVTDNTTVIYQAIQDMEEGSELFIPPNVKWDNSPSNVYPLMKNYTRIEDHSGYDSRYPSVWHHHVMTYQHTTENTGTTNGNGIINRGDYHPYFCIIVDTLDGGAGSRGSLIIRQDGEMLQLGTDKTQAGQECFAISTYGDIVEGSKAMRMGMQKSSAPHCFAYNSSLITDITYVYGKHLKRPNLTEAQYLAANHSTRHTQPANHTGSFLTTYFVGASEKFRQNIDKDGNLTWRSSGSTARFNFDNTGALFGHTKKTRVGSISGTVGVDDSHSFFSNYGATGGQIVSLPTPKAGYYLEISVDTAQNVIVSPAAGTNFIGMGAGKTKTSNVVGSKLKIVGLDSTTWSFEQIGTWTDQV